ncbi:unnamed protein product [Protopolystoma xenopodis]|uniref:Uncharacterized protein n=1 Tax=Protopolystoma xenopodis TaxID=117903 RepID=A0A448XR18_9PLAT|nr:unnamed protein product [Protopolystoma xenopodis]
MLSRPQCLALVSIRPTGSSFLPTRLTIASRPYSIKLVEGLHLFRKNRSMSSMFASSKRLLSTEFVGPATLRACWRSVYLPAEDIEELALSDPGRSSLLFRLLDLIDQEALTTLMLNKAYSSAHSGSHVDTSDEKNFPINSGLTGTEDGTATDTVGNKASATRLDRLIVEPLLDLELCLSTIISLLDVASSPNLSGYYTITSDGFRIIIRVFSIVILLLGYNYEDGHDYSHLHYSFHLLRL